MVDRPTMDDKRQSLDLRSTAFASEGQGGKTKQFFGRIFKKKEPRDLEIAKTPIGSRISPAPSFSSHHGGPQPNPGGLNGQIPIVHVKAPSSTSTPLVPENAQGHFSVGHPTFGTAPVIVHRRSSGTMVTPEGAITGLTGPAELGISLSNSSAISADRHTALSLPPSSRPIGYTWTIRKWAKRNTEGWAAHLVAATAAGLEIINGTPTGQPDDEVVFEWVKLRAPSVIAGSSLLKRYSNAVMLNSTMRTQSHSRTPSAHKLDIGTPSPGINPVSLNLAPPERTSSPIPSAASLPSPSLDSRPEPVRRVSTSTSPTSRHDSASENELTQDEGEDSDPEDSERPWTCSVWVKKTGHRQLLGTLTPAPHHPKVIGMLKIPMGLDPIALTEVRGESNDQQEMANRVREEVALTEENLKDVVCVTAMWLVAREEFGGLGKKRKV